MVTETSERGRRGDVDVEMVGDFVGTNTPYHRKHFTFSLNSSAKTAKKLRENGRQQSLCDSGFACFSAKKRFLLADSKAFVTAGLRVFLPKTW
jgi:hypothetical protein